MKKISFVFFGFRFWVFILVLVLTGCSKDYSGDPCGEPENGLTESFRVSGEQHNFPSINPFNKSELLYLYKESPSSNGQIMFRDLSSHTSKIVSESITPLNQPKWVNESTVVFANRQYQVVELNVRTGETEILPFPMLNIYACTDSSENVYSCSSENLGHPYYFLRYTRNNQVIDTLLGSDHSINGYSTRNDVSGSNQLVGQTSLDGVWSIGIKDLDSTDFKVLLKLDGNFDRFLNSLNWYGNTSTVLASLNNYGVFAINSTSGNISKVIDACWRYNYTSLSSDAENEFIYAEKIIKWDDPDDGWQGLIYQQSIIVRIDLNGGYEEEILF